jgi:Rab GDP dissociation inhibitor
MAEFDGGAKAEDGKEEKPSWLGAGEELLADGEYDAIVMGTGLSECIVNGLLSTKGMRVLHLDRNNYYGADSASLALNSLYEKFGKSEDSIPKKYGRVNDWAVDLIPKFIMADGDLTKILLHSKVTRYLRFKSIDGSYVYKSGKVEKVPSTPAEALSSNLMGFFEKRKFRNFLIYCDKYNEADRSTWMKGKPLTNWSCADLFAWYDLGKDTQSFIGHAMMLFDNDSYLDRAASEAVAELKLYMDSMQRYEPYYTPYIYPEWGLGGLPEGFSRLAAVYGGVFMLNRGVDEVIMKDGKAWGVRSNNEDGVPQVAKASIIIGDPSYFGAEKKKKVGQVVRSICILNHPIPNTNDCESVQIIIPAAQVGRVNDVYVCMISNSHCVCSEGYYIAIVSTTMEKSGGIEEEIGAGLSVLGPIEERFDSVSDLYAPTDDGTADGCFVSRSYDAASHFEQTAQDVLSLYERVTKEKLDMSISPEINEDEY